MNKKMSPPDDGGRASKGNSSTNFTATSASVKRWCAAPADILLSKLDGVKRTGDARWVALCPAHFDRKPSLAVRELDDGRVLLHCFAGCSVAEIVAAVGVELSDLYPQRISSSHIQHPERRPFPAADVLRCISYDALVIASNAVTLLDGRPFSEADRARLTLAASRLQSAAGLAGVLP